MKKVVSLALACLLLVGMISCIGFSASAATPKEEIVAAVKAAMPDAYEDQYLPMLENVLAQIEVSAEQAEAVIANIDAVKEEVKADKGASLSEYAAEEIEVVLENFDEACTTLGLTYELVDAENPTHEGDLDCKIYVDGKQIGSVDGDGVKKTNAPEFNGALLVALIGMLTVAGVAAVYGKKLVASR